MLMAVQCEFFWQSACRLNEDRKNDERQVHLYIDRKKCPGLALFKVFHLKSQVLALLIGPNVGRGLRPIQTWSRNTRTEQEEKRV